jgi:hypothetical protein
MAEDTAALTESHAAVAVRAITQDSIVLGGKT